MRISDTGRTPFHDAAEHAVTESLASAGFAFVDREVNLGESGVDYLVTARIAETPLHLELYSHGANIWAGPLEAPTIDERFEVYDYDTPEAFCADLSAVVLQHARRFRSVNSREDP